MSLNHVALTVADRERSAAFYGKHFGLTQRVHEDEHLLILGPAAGGADGSLLAVKQGTPVADSLPSANHFGFEVTSGDEVRAARERFHEAGSKRRNGRTATASSGCRSSTRTDTASSCTPTGP